MGTSINTCGCCTIFTCRICCDPDVTPPTSLTMTIGFGLRGSVDTSAAYIKDNDFVPFCFSSCGVSGTWTIPLVAVGAPPGTSFPYCWVNELADYYPGSYPEALTKNVQADYTGTLFNADFAGYQSVPNPEAGCSAPFCCTPIDALGSSGFGTCAGPNPNCTTLTIGNNMGVSVFVGACGGSAGGSPYQNSLVVIISLLDLDTPHIPSCTNVFCDPTSNGDHLGGYVGTYGVNVAIQAFTCSNPYYMGGMSIPPTNATLMISNCGTCYGTVLPNIFGMPCWARDDVVYSIPYDYIYIAGGEGQCVAESMTATAGAVCAEALFNNTYTLTITGDISPINGTYKLAFVGCNTFVGQNGFWTCIGPPFQCTYSDPSIDPIILFPQFGLIYNDGRGYWLLSTIAGSSHAATYTCGPNIPFTASGSFTVPTDPFRTQDPNTGVWFDCQACGCPTGGNVYWMVS